MEKIAKVDKFAVNGIEYAVDPGVEYNMQTEIKEAIASITGISPGYKSEGHVPYVKAKIYLNSGTSADFLDNDDEISVEVAWGANSIIGQGGTKVGESPHSLADGTIEVEIRFNTLVRA